MANVETTSEHLAPTEEISLQVVKKRAVRGIATLTGRTFILQIISLVAFALLGGLLTPEQMGVYFLAFAIKNFFAYFADIGLAAAIIQKKEEVTERELRTTFTVQQGQVILLLIIMIAATPLFKAWYGLSQDSVYFLWALGASLLLSSLRTIPSTLMERELKFGKFVIPQIVDALIFYVLSVTLVWMGLGITSFTIAVLVSGSVSLILTYVLYPWMPGFAFSKDALRRLLRFGLPYQVNTFLAVAKDDGMTMFLGGILGPAGIGYIIWAKKWADLPLRFAMDPVNKVTFPAFSRMQHDAKELSSAVNKSILYICSLVFPSVLGLIIIAGPVIETIPWYAKWEPALFALALVGINSAFAAVTTPLTNFLSATGRISITFRLMVMWTVLTWVLLPFLAIHYSVNGAALGFALVGISSIFAIFWASKFAKINFWGSIVKPLIACLVMGMVIFVAGNIIPLNVLGIVGLVLLGIVSYTSTLSLLVGKQAVADIKSLYGTSREN